MVYYCLLTLHVLFDFQNTPQQHYKFFIERICLSLLFPSLITANQEGQNENTALSSLETIRTNPRIQSLVFDILVEDLSREILRTEENHGSFEKIPLLHYCISNLSRCLLSAGSDDNESSNDMSEKLSTQEQTLSNIMIFSKHLLDCKSISDSQIMKQYFEKLFELFIKNCGVLKFGLTLSSLQTWNIDIAIAGRLRKCFFLNLMPHFFQYNYSTYSATREHLLEILHVIQIMNQSYKSQESNTVLQNISSDPKTKQIFFDQLLHESFMLLCQYYDAFFKIDLDSQTFVIDLRQVEWIWESILENLVVNSETFIGKRSLYLIKRLILDTTCSYPYMSSTENISSFLTQPIISKQVFKNSKAKEAQSKKKQTKRTTPQNEEDSSLLKIHEMIQYQWQTFFMIYESLENHSLHLIKPVWESVFELIPKRGEEKPFKYFIDQRFVRVLWIRAMRHSNFGVVKLVAHSMLDIYDTIEDRILITSNDSTEILEKNLLLDKSFMCGEFIECISMSKLFTTKQDYIGEKVFLFFDAYFAILEKIGKKKTFIQAFIAKIASARWSRVALSFFLLVLARMKFSSENDYLDLNDLSAFCEKVILLQLSEQSLWLKLRLYSSALEVIVNCFNFKKLCEENPQQLMDIIGKLFSSVSSVDPLTYSSDIVLLRRLRNWFGECRESFEKTYLTYMRNLLNQLLSEETSSIMAYLSIEKFATLLYFIPWDESTIAEQCNQVLAFNLSLTFPQMLEKLYTHTQMPHSVKVRMLNLLSAILNSCLFVSTFDMKEHYIMKQVKDTICSMIFTRSNLESILMFIRGEILSISFATIPELAQFYKQLLMERNFSIFNYSDYDSFKGVVNCLLCVSQLLMTHREEYEYLQREMLHPLLTEIATLLKKYFDTISSVKFLERLIEQSVENTDMEDASRNAHTGLITLLVNNITLRVLCVAKLISIMECHSRNTSKISQHLNTVSKVSYFIIPSTAYGYKEVLGDDFDWIMKPNYIISEICDKKWGAIECLMPLVFDEKQHVQNEEDEQILNNIRQDKEFNNELLEMCMDSLDILSNETTILAINSLKYLIHNMLVQNEKNLNFIEIDKLKRCINTAWSMLKGSTGSEGGTHGHRYTNEHVNMAAFFEIIFDFNICKNPDLYEALEISKLFDKILTEYAKSVSKLGFVLGLQFIKSFASKKWRELPTTSASRKHMISDFISLIFYCPDTNEYDELEETERAFKSLCSYCQEQNSNSANMKQRTLVYPPIINTPKILKSAIFYMINGLDTEKDREFIKALVGHLIEMNISNSYLRKQPVMPGSPKHCKKIRIWQILCMLAPIIDLEILQSMQLLHEQNGSGKIWDCLFLDNPSSVRKLQELFALVILLKFPLWGFHSLYCRLKEDMNARHQFLSSVVSLVGNVIIYSPEEFLWQESSVDPKKSWLHVLLNGLFVYATSNYHTVRVVTHIMLRNVLYRMGGMNNKKGQDMMKNNDILERVYCFLHNSQNVKKWLGKYESTIVVEPVKTAQQLFLNYFYEGTNLVNDNPTEDHLKTIKEDIDLLIYSLFYISTMGFTKDLFDRMFTPQFGVSNINAILKSLIEEEFNQSPLTTTPRSILPVGSIDDFTTIAALCHIAGDFANEWREEVVSPSRTAKTEKHASIIYKGLASVFDSSIIDKFRVKFGLTETDQSMMADSQPLEQEQENEESTDEQQQFTKNKNSEDLNDSTELNFQRKITPWSEMDIQNELNPRAVIEKSRKRQSVIMIASLVDRIPNLAGLSRTCEIFAAEKLILPYLNVLEMNEFKTISVSAENWIPVEACPPTDLPQYLTQKKQEGYAIVGLEQTSTSVMLPNFEFPEKCCILLGKEREGIPAELLSLLDVCVEIPQFGVLRSLNVHVSASIMLYKYTEQFLKN